jgi:hypothetical protein
MSFCGAVIDFTYLQVWVFLTQDGGLPPTVNIMLQAACAYQAKSVLLAYTIKFYCYVFIHKKLVLF